MVLLWAFLIWLLLGWPIAHLLIPLVISTISCPGCGEEIDAVDSWKCTCGYRHFRDRHILIGRCPKCDKVAGHVTCPRCSCTILLW
jgi:hypothetical protein